MNIKNKCVGKSLFMLICIYKNNNDKNSILIVLLVSSILITINNIKYINIYY